MGRQEGCDSTVNISESLRICEIKEKNESRARFLKGGSEHIRNTMMGEL